MSDFGPGAREFLQSYVDEHGFLSWLDVRVEAVEPGRLVMRIPFQNRLTNPQIEGDQRTIHGGVAATLVDTTGGLAVRSDLDAPLAGGVATVDLNVSYLRPATDDLVATAEVVRVGRTIGVAEVEVESVDERGRDGGGKAGEGNEGERTLVAVGRGSYRVFREDGDNGE